jgi:fumarate reductase subunit C
MSTAYVRPPDLFWWTRRRAYLTFVLRELTSVFVAWSIVFLLMLLRALTRGQAEYEAFWHLAGAPWMIVVNLVALVAVTFHSITFLNLAPKTMVVRLDGWRVPGFMIAGGNYSAWLVISAVIAFFLLR